MSIIKVFIFEDDWMCREALVSVIGKDKEIEVIGDAEDVGEGLNRALRIKPDVVLMDIRYFGQNLGIKATASIKEKLPETKVIVFTDFPDEVTLREAIGAGASGYLLKKEVQDPDTIIRAVKTVFHGNAYMTPAVTAKILNIIKNQTQNGKYDLTKRELEILKLIAKGKENKKIADSLNINIRTVANHVSNILYKINAKNRTEAAMIAGKEGLIV